MKTKTIQTLLGLALGTLVATPALTAETTDPAPPPGAEQQSGADMAELAKKLNNPAASLISVPLQNNFDFGGGPNDDGFHTG